MFQKARKDRTIQNLKEKKKKELAIQRNETSLIQIKRIGVAVATTKTIYPSQLPI